MRLLSSITVTQEEFAPDDIPPYAILSHTWGKSEDEISFADMQRGGFEHKKGYYKLSNACKQAYERGLEWIWVDTCCIDKSSSAELSEAINSMYKWYEQSVVCFVYLEDVALTRPSGKTLKRAVIKSAIQDCRWFTRGWTLQEFLAPRDVRFFSSDWTECDESKADMSTWLASFTGIDEAILKGERHSDTVSVAKRMSWASRRQTTRAEDLAYCLMGIFDVNMPLLYGEGDKAFIRLQEEIIKNSDDQSLFVWEDDEADPNTFCGLLARSPRCFFSSGDIVPYTDWELSAPFLISNKGLRIELHLSPHGPRPGYYMATLNCPAPPEYNGFIGICLYHLETGGQDQYGRVNTNRFYKLDDSGELKKTIYVRQKALLEPFSRAIFPFHLIYLRNGPSKTHGYELVRYVSEHEYKGETPEIENERPSDPWIPVGYPETFILSKRAASFTVGLIFQCTSGVENLAVLLGSNNNFGFDFDVVSVPDVEEDVDYGQRYEPHEPGTNKVLGNHHVCVEVEHCVSEGHKVFVVDILMREIKFQLDLNN